MALLEAVSSLRASLHPSGFPGLVLGCFRGWRSRTQGRDEKALVPERNRGCSKRSNRWDGAPRCGTRLPSDWAGTANSGAADTGWPHSSQLNRAFKSAPSLLRARGSCITLLGHPQTARGQPAPGRYHARRAAAQPVRERLRCVTSPNWPGLPEWQRALASG